MTERQDGAGQQAAAITRRSLARNTIFNLAGYGLPTLAALVCIPGIVHKLGTERFGVLTLCWVLIGYFGLFDLGLGRAVTRLVAERLAGGRLDGLGGVLRMSLGILTGLGVLAGLGLWLLADPVVHRVLEIPDALKDETFQTIALMACTLPAVVLTTGLRGILEARHRFDLVTLVQAPASSLNFFGPLVALQFAPGLLPVVWVLVVTRYLSAIAFAALGWDLITRRDETPLDRKAELRDLARFGGWLTVSNLVGPVMVYFDRLLLGALVPIGLVAYYTTPAELTQRLRIVPTALTGALFPSLSAVHRDPVAVRSLVEQTTKMLMVLLFPVVLVGVGLAGELLGLWLNSEFARSSARALQILLVGNLINAIGSVFFTVLQAAGRSDLTAKLHLCEALPYVAVLWGLTSLLGIEGAALAWSLRVAVDTVALGLLARRHAEGGHGLGRRSLTVILGLVAALCLVAPVGPLVPRAILVIVLGLGFAVVAWTVWLTPRERSGLTRLVLRRA